MIDEKQNIPDGIQAVEYAIKTVEDPTSENILNDIKLIFKIISDLKNALHSAHPSVKELLKLLF